MCFNTRQFIANQQVKTVFVTNSMILITIHWKTTTNLLKNLQKKLLQCEKSLFFDNFDLKTIFHKIFIYTKIVFFTLNY